MASALQLLLRSVRRRMLTLNGPENYCSVSNQRIRQWGVSGLLLPEKRRKDAVLAVEYVMTASPEWWKEATPRQQAEFSPALSNGWRRNTGGRIVLWRRWFTGTRPPALVSVRGAIDAGWTAVREKSLLAGGQRCVKIRAPTLNQ